MQISIIIPIYNVEKYIERCIKSVIAQTFTDYEVILVDDASPDNALQIAEKLLQKNDIEFRTIKHPKNQGSSESRNKGIKVANGKYLMFVDSDDMLAHNKVLSSFYAVMQKDNYDFVTANVNLIDDTNEITQPHQWLGDIKKDTILSDDAILENFLSRKLYVFAGNKLINKNFLMENKLFFKKGIIVCEDELWCFQMCMVATKCYLLSEYCYNYDLSNFESITKNKNKKFYDDKLYVMQEQLNAIIKQREAKKVLSVSYKNNGSVDVKANTFVYNYKVLSLSVLRPIYNKNKNKEWWIEYYQKIREIYKASKLYPYKKLFILPPEMAYFIFSEQRHPSYPWRGKRVYKKLMKLFNRCNLG